MFNKRLFRSTGLPFSPGRLFFRLLQIVFVASSLSATVGVLGLFLFGWTVTPVLSGLLTAGLVMGIVYDLTTLLCAKRRYFSRSSRWYKFFQLLFHAALLSSVLQMSSTIAMGAFAAAFGGVACLYVATWLIYVFSAVKELHIKLKASDSNAGKNFVGYLILSILLLVMNVAMCLPALFVPLMFSDVVGGETIVIAVFLSMVLFAVDQLLHELSAEGLFNNCSLPSCKMLWKNLISEGSALSGHISKNGLGVGDNSLYPRCSRARIVTTDSNVFYSAGGVGGPGKTPDMQSISVKGLQ